MEDKEILENCFKDVVWMAIRYANGRHTYAPGMVRDAVKNFQKVFPDWKPKHDLAVFEDAERMKKFDEGSACFESDYLTDLFEE